MWNDLAAFSRARLRNLALAAVILLLCILSLTQHHQSWAGAWGATATGQNTTLGFEKIVVVSSGTSWRVDGLIEAARFTGIGLEIPKQPEWSDKEVDAFRGADSDGKAKKLGPGQARCWLGHLNAMHEMLTQHWTTALIVEDDADWDIAIKNQVAALAPVIRKVSNSSETGSQWSPYGDSWDLLWVGNCGDLSPGPDAISIMDITLPDSPLYRGVYGKYSYQAPHIRTVYRSISPLCTYAYAITANAALKIYQAASKGVDRIITIELREMCRKGHLRCFTVSPELFHHHKKAGEVSSEIAVVEGWDDLATTEKVGYTANIRYSARCNSQNKGLVKCQDEN
ncbi:hypothetical protein GQ53DRAFT_822129 [Thozetella sp. PMI_491]|nr:hypothetical protein GQ53DRAFT_822129 [Thozetella sp. PMI_491]